MVNGEQMFIFIIKLSGTLGADHTVQAERLLPIVAASKVFHTCFDLIVLFLLQRLPSLFQRPLSLLYRSPYLLRRKAHFL